MRDPNRIPLVLDAIRQVWERHPDMRLGQLLTAAWTFDRNDFSAVDLFYVEDDKLIAAVKKI